MKITHTAEMSKWMKMMLISALLVMSETYGQEQEDKVCISGYVMDTFCIERGTLFDNPTIVSLEEPEVHSAHCLLEVSSCVNSGYEVLADPEEGTITYSRAFALDDTGNQKFLEFGLSIGKCDDCSGTQQKGLQATLFGSIVPNTGSVDTPEIFAVTSISPFADGCGDTPLAIPSNVVTSAGGFQNIIRLHASLMLTGWGLLLPSGVLMARLLRHRPSGLWFKLHRGVQVLGLTVAVVGWSIALANFSTFVVHGMFGMTVMVLGILQPINAFLRPHATEPGKTPTSNRMNWERLHKGVGYLLPPLAAVTIVLGTLAVPTQSDQSMFQMIYGVIVVLLVLFGIALSYDKKKYDSVSDHEELAVTPVEE